MAPSAPYSFLMIDERLVATPLSCQEEALSPHLP